MNVLKRVVNKLLRHFESRILPTDGKVVYLTFDDGPEPGITEFVLDELDKYDFKATFFCRGDNAEKNPQLLSLLKSQGHGLGNHTYSHLHSYEVGAKTYINDVDKADNVLHTELFRPPHGSLTFAAWLKLQKKYCIYFWSLNSGDSDLQLFDYNRSVDNLKANTKSGDIVLFHFCHRHEKETRKVLPEYLQWLYENGYKCNVIR